LPTVYRLRGLFYSAYTKCYLRLQGATMDELERWMLPVAAARLHLDLEQERPKLLAWIGELMGTTEFYRAERLVPCRTFC
jgi:hypothetical protein